MRFVLLKELKNLGNASTRAVVVLTKLHMTLLVLLTPLVACTSTGSMRADLPVARLMPEVASSSATSVTLAVTLDHSNSAGMLSVQAVESRNSAPGSHSTMTPAGTLTWVTTLYREGEPKEPEPGMMICAWALKAACRIGWIN